jgi:hypothetical protein
MAEITCRLTVSGKVTGLSAERTPGQQIKYIFHLNISFDKVHLNTCLKKRAQIISNSIEFLM